MSSLRVRYLALFGLLLVVLLILYLTRTSGPAVRSSDPARWTPEQTLEAFIEAQESGQVDRVKEFLVEKARENFTEMSAEMSQDDLVATGLQFREQRYQLEETTAESATFYSPPSALYLVMTKEANRWRVDPERTDKLNKELSQ